MDVSMQLDTTKKHNVIPEEVTNFIKNRDIGEINMVRNGWTINSSTSKRLDLHSRLGTHSYEARDTPAELREEFAQRYENDKEQMVEAMDKMIRDVIEKNLRVPSKIRHRSQKIQLIQAYERAFKSAWSVCDGYTWQRN